jgi:hypothetical protein
LQQITPKTQLFGPKPHLAINSWPHKKDDNSTFEVSLSDGFPKKLHPVGRVQLAINPQN